MNLAIQEKSTQQGFTIIEVMVTMVVALFVLAGMTSLFVSQTRTTQMLNQKSEAMSDLFLASQLIQVELRDAKAVCWEGSSKMLGYQPIDSTVNISAACGGANDPENGYFLFKAATATKSACICWDRPNKNDNCQELIRGLVDGAGMQVIDAGGLNQLKKITLSSEYQGKDLSKKVLSLSFKAWPRNQQ